VPIRRATQDDLPFLHGVFRGAVDDLFFRHGFEPPRPPEDYFQRLNAHVLEHDPEAFWVAEEKGALTGFVAALVRGDTWFLSALFVVPARQGRGVGKELFARAWEAGGNGIARRLTVVDAIQPISTGMYSRAGLVPVTPLLSLAGEPQALGDAGLDPVDSDSAVLARIDAAAYGFDRAADHGFWGHEARRTLWARGGAPVAYSYRWPGGRIGPVAGLTPEDAGGALESELERAAGRFVSLVVPGSAGPALAGALRAGLRYSDPPGLVLTTDGDAPTRLVPHGYSLL
jgi:GNAT superfamily N-acetyltransferase